MSDVMSETVVAPRGSRPVLGRYHVGNAVVDGPAERVDRRAMGIAVLGSLVEDGAASSLGLPDRVVLQTLAVSTRVPARADALAETIWGKDLPASWAKVVQGCVGRIRKALGADVSETSPQGYHLVHHADHIGQQAVGLDWLDEAIGRHTPRSQRGVRPTGVAAYVLLPANLPEPHPAEMSCLRRPSIWS